MNSISGKSGVNPAIPRHAPRPSLWERIRAVTFDIEASLNSLPSARDVDSAHGRTNLLSKDMALLRYLVTGESAGNGIKPVAAVDRPMAEDF